MGRGGNFIHPHFLQLPAWEGTHGSKAPEMKGSWSVHKVRLWTGICILQPSSASPLHPQIPLVPLTPALSILLNICLMLKLSYLTWLRFIFWLLVGEWGLGVDQAYYNGEDRGQVGLGPHPSGSRPLPQDLSCILAMASGTARRTRGSHWS